MLNNASPAVVLTRQVEELNRFPNLDMYDIKPPSRNQYSMNSCDSGNFYVVFDIGSMTLGHRVSVKDLKKGKWSIVLKHKVLLI